MFDDENFNQVYGIHHDAVEQIQQLNDVTQNKESNMNYPTAEYYDERIRLLQERQAKNLQVEIEALERQRDYAIQKQLEADALLERFGSNDDWPDESTISYKVRYNGRGIEYTFVAVKVGTMGGWYTTNKNDRNWYTWEELISKYLSKATSVYYVGETGWVAI